MAMVLCPHARLLALAGNLALPDPATPAALAAMGRRLAEIADLAEALADGELAILVRRWSFAGAIAADPPRFAASWALLLAAMRRLAAATEPVHGYPQPLHAPQPTGLPGVDHGHHRTLALIGGLRAAAGGGRDHLDGATVSGLAAIAHPHAAEEDIMRVTRCPGLAEHRAEHRLAHRILAGFAARHRAGSRVGAIDVLGFLEHWLAAHAGIVDQAMARHAATASWSA